MALRKPDVHVSGEAKQVFDREATLAATEIETTSVRCSCVRIVAVTGHTRLIALADVRVEIAGIEMAINGVRVQREPRGTAVRLPIDRHGRALVELPEEVRTGLGDTVLAAGLEAGILKELAR
jgi:hypothetical protein